MSKKREDIMKELHQKANQIDRQEEFRAKYKYEKKPRAIRKYEKYANMGEKKDVDISS